MNIILSPLELTYVSNIGTLRYLQKIKKGAVNTSLESETQGAAAEMAVSKILNCYFSGLYQKERPTDPDIVAHDGTRYFVRRQILLTAELRIDQSYAAEEARIVLVTGIIPSLHVSGWISRKDAQVARFACKNEKYLFWLIPQKELTKFTARPNYNGLK